MFGITDRNQPPLGLQRREDAGKTIVPGLVDAIQVRMFLQGVLRTLHGFFGILIGWNLRNDADVCRRKRKVNRVD